MRFFYFLVLFQEYSLSLHFIKTHFELNLKKYNSMNLKVRLAVMNFLEFAVWGAYLTSMGNYLGKAGMGAEAQ